MEMGTKNKEKKTFNALTEGNIYRKHQQGSCYFLHVFTIKWRASCSFSIYTNFGRSRHMTVNWMEWYISMHFICLKYLKMLGCCSPSPTGVEIIIDVCSKIERIILVCHFNRICHALWNLSYRSKTHWPIPTIKSTFVSTQQIRHVVVRGCPVTGV